MTHKEEVIELLSKKIQDHTPQSYYEFIVGLYTPRTSAGKRTVEKVKGKKLRNFTKKLPGIFEARFRTALGLKTIFFMFDRDMACSPKLLADDTLKQLGCTRNHMEIFLKEKKLNPHVLSTGQKRETFLRLQTDTDQGAIDENRNKFNSASTAEEK